MDTNYEIVELTGSQYIELESDGPELIALHVGNDPDAESVTVGLTLDEAEALIAKLAVKLAQARLAAVAR